MSVCRTSGRTLSTGTPAGPQSVEENRPSSRTESESHTGGAGGTPAGPRGDCLGGTAHPGTRWQFAGGTIRPPPTPTPGVRVSGQSMEKRGRREP